VSVGAEESLLGRVERVTVSIPGNGPGEVLLPVRSGSEAFAADHPMGNLPTLVDATAEA
jgi:hypothetical protein